MTIHINDLAPGLVPAVPGGSFDRQRWLDRRLEQIKPSARADVELVGRVLHEEGPVAAARSLAMVAWLGDAVVWEVSAMKEMAIVYAQRLAAWQSAAADAEKRQPAAVGTPNPTPGAGARPGCFCEHPASQIEDVAPEAAAAAAGGRFERPRG